MSSTPQVTSLRPIAVAAYGPTVLSSIGTGAVLPVLALTARDLGASVGTAAVIVSLLGVGMLVGDLPAGALAARFGERRALLAASVAEAVGMTAAGLAPSVVTLAAAVLALGLAGSVFGLARHAYLTNAVAPSLRARALSTLGGVHRVGIFVGPFVGALVLSWWGSIGPYAVGAAAALAAGGLVAVTKDLAVRDAAHRADRASTVRSREGSLTVFRVLRDHRRVLTTLGFGVIAVAATRAARNAIVPLWAEAIGLDATSTSIVFGLSGAADMLLFYPAGWAMDRFGRVHVAVPSMLVLGLGMVLVPFASTFWALVVVATVLGIGNGIGSGILMTLGADASPEVGRAQFLGGWRLMGDIGWASGPALVSAVAVLASLGTASVVMGVVAWAGAAWLKVWVPRFDPIRPERSTPEQ
ncbi:MAG: MFS transporter [Actinomycetales bacterium]|uniref:MFS transporter n=1 Tax=Candidatus Phosphoribacter hodrii TaxID=2953743 RepID=A0A934X501_9MICO|nr:MFS transporter [Candidatus Phosphoribacter hodrii]